MFSILGCLYKFVVPSCNEQTAKAIVKASSSGSRESSNTSLSVGKSLRKTGLKSTGNVKVNGVRKQHYLAIEDSHPEGNRALEKTAEVREALSHITCDCRNTSMNLTDPFLSLASNPVSLSTSRVQMLLLTTSALML